MIFKLDNKSREPMYEQLEKLIAKYISAGVLNEGDQLPSVRSMAQQLGINPNTVAKTYKILENEGIIYTIVGKGAFIAESSAAKSVIKKEYEAAFLSAAQNAKNMGFGEGELISLIQKLYKSKGGNEDD